MVNCHIWPANCTKHAKCTSILDRKDFFHEAVAILKEQNKLEIIIIYKRGQLIFHLFLESQSSMPFVVREVVLKNATKPLYFWYSDEEYLKNILCFHSTIG